MERRRCPNASANITGGNNRFLFALFFEEIKQAFAIYRRRSHEILIEPLTRRAGATRRPITLAARFVVVVGSDISSPGALSRYFSKCFCRFCPRERAYACRRHRGYPRQPAMIHHAAWIRVGFRLISHCAAAFTRSAKLHPDKPITPAVNRGTRAYAS